VPSCSVSQTPIVPVGLADVGDDDEPPRIGGDRLEPAAVQRRDLLARHRPAELGHDRRVGLHRRGEREVLVGVEAQGGDQASSKS
jgi:hypothetical protein